MNKKDENFQEEVKRINSKIREGFLPLPPKTMSVLVESAEGKEPEDALLYGLRGKAFANKQMNYIVKKICEHLGWIIKTSVTEKEDLNNGSKTKTDKYFTPHGLRYSVATIFHDMGVEDNAIRMLLLHSKKTTQGALSRYFRKIQGSETTSHGAIITRNGIRNTLEIEEKFNVEMDLEAIYEQLPVAFGNQMKNTYYVNVFKEDMIRFTFSKKMEQMLSTTTNHSNSLFHTAEGINVAPSHSMAPINPYQQYGLQPTGYRMVPLQMNYNYPPQPPTGHHPSYFYGPYA